MQMTGRSPEQGTAHAAFLCFCSHSDFQTRAMTFLRSPHCSIMAVLRDAPAPVSAASHRTCVDAWQHGHGPGTSPVPFPIPRATRADIQTSYSPVWI